METKRPLRVVDVGERNIAAGASPDERPAHDRDAPCAERIAAAAQKLNEAMAEAVKAGLIVQPRLSQASNRFGDLGMAETTHILNVQVYRNLSGSIASNDPTSDGDDPSKGKGNAIRERAKFYREEAEKWPHLAEALRAEAERLNGEAHRLAPSPE